MKNNQSIFVTILCICIIICTYVGLQTFYKVKKLQKQVSRQNEHSIQAENANKYELIKIRQRVESIHKHLMPPSPLNASIENIDKLASLLKVFSASDSEGVIKLSRMGKDFDGGYVVPEKALSASDVLLGYGIREDISFEEQYSQKYNKASYGFDCGVQTIPSNTKLFTLVSECISSESFVENKESSSGKVSNFSEQINKLGLNGKKLFVKMDIEGAEYDAFPDILKHSNNITGIAVEIHMFQDPAKQIEQAIKLISSLQNDFVLVHVNGPNCLYPHYDYFYSNNSAGKIPPIIELSYINKNLIKDWKISENQKHPTSLDRPCIECYPDSKFEILVK